MTEIQALTAEVKALRKVQAKQTEDMLRLTTKISDMTATIEALNFFSHSVALSHQDMTLLLGHFHGFFAAAEQTPPRQAASPVMQSLKDAMIQTINAQSHPADEPD